MNERPITAETPETEPPRLIASFASGFNTVANNIHLLLLPLALDLLLWFGPHLRLKNLLMPLVTDAVRLMRETSRQRRCKCWMVLRKSGRLFWSITTC